MRFFAVLVATTHALHAVPPQNRRHGVVCHGKKTNAILGALRRVPLVKRVVPKKERAPRTPPPPETSVEAAPEIAELIDAEADEAAKVLEAVVQQVVERGVAVPYETVEKPEEPKPEKQPEESQIERFDRLHASPMDRTDELLKLLRDASRDTNAVDVDVEWRYARACLDALVRVGARDVRRARSDARRRAHARPRHARAVRVRFDPEWREQWREQWRAAGADRHPGGLRRVRRGPVVHGASDAPDVGRRENFFTERNSNGIRRIL